MQLSSLHVPEFDFDTRNTRMHAWLKRCFILSTVLALNSHARTEPLRSIARYVRRGKGSLHAHRLVCRSDPWGSARYAGHQYGDCPTRKQLMDLLDRFPETHYYADRETALQALFSRSQFNVIDFATGWKVDFIIGF